LLAELSEGFRLLAVAQARPQCVFEAGLSSASWLPHVQCARTVMRAALLKIELALARRDSDAVHADMEMLLRLSRDLCPRGCSICQLVSMSLQGEVLDLIDRVLDLPWIEAANCERLLALLAAHEESLPDRFTIAHQMEYLMYRIEFEELVKLRKEQASRGDSPPRPRFADLKIDPSAKGDVRFQRVAESLTLEEARAQIAALDRYYVRFMLLWQFPYRACVSGMFVSTDELSARADSVLVGISAATCEVLATTIVREQTRLHGVQCLIALRMWQLRHEGPPPTLVEATRAAGLANVPRDEFAGGPMRLTLYSDTWVVYSLGEDGEDSDGNWVLPDDKGGDFSFMLNATP